MIKVINLHRVTDPKWFNDLILLLYSQYRLVSLETLVQLFETDKAPGKMMHITFDDGDRSFYINAFPVLKKYKIPSSLFVSPLACERQLNFWFQEISGYNQEDLKKSVSAVTKVSISKLAGYEAITILMCLKLSQINEIIKTYQVRTGTPARECQNINVEQLLEIEKSGFVRIGAHTINHPILANEDADDSRIEITSSIDRLSSLLGCSVGTFAYPNGTPGVDFTSREMEYLKSNGIKLAFSTEHKNASSSDDRLSIPRYGITYGSMQFIKTKLFMGAFWDKMKQLTSKSEADKRKELYEILN
jgi:peptidoglycan/xylan/chitin deacetylase (PgdA/CDA1 family)